MDDEIEQSSKLRQLTEQVNGKMDANDRLLLSLSRFKNLIHENRISPPVKDVQTKVEASKEKRSSMSADWNVSSSSSSSSDEDDSDDSTPVNRRRRAPSRNSSSDLDEPSESGGRKKVQQKRKRAVNPKKIKNGVFVYLPYTAQHTAEKKSSDYLLDVSKKLQLGRFLGRRGHLADLEQQFSARLNLVTPKTTQLVTQALDDAKKGLEKLTIYKAQESLALSKEQDGAWVLIRPKKNPNSKMIPNIDQLVDDLTHRWETCLAITKRVRSDSEDSVEATLQKRRN